MQSSTAHTIAMIMFTVAGILAIYVIAFSVHSWWKGRHRKPGFKSSILRMDTAAAELLDDANEKLQTRVQRQREQSTRMGGKSGS